MQKPIIYRYNTNFWQVNEHLLILKTYKDFFEGDKSKDKEQSSDIMWAIHFCYDYESQYATLPPKARRQLIEKEHINPKYSDDPANETTSFFEENKQLLQPLINLYMELQKDSKRAYLEQWRITVEKRKEFLENAEYDISTLEKLDKAIMSSSKILEQEEELIAIAEKEKLRVKGEEELTQFAKDEIKPSYDVAQQHPEQHGHLQLDSE